MNALLFESVCLEYLWKISYIINLNAGKKKTVKVKKKERYCPELCDENFTKSHRVRFTESHKGGCNLKANAIYMMTPTNSFEMITF